MAFTVQAFYNAINLVRSFLAPYRFDSLMNTFLTGVPVVQLGQLLHLLCKRSTVVMFCFSTLIKCVLTGHLDIITGRSRFRYPQH